jgi:hypothetical protein
MKFCKDCKHHTAIAYSHYCKAAIKRSVTSFVTGKKYEMYEPCNFAREMSDICGPEAKLYERKWWKIWIINENTIYS